MLKEFNLQLPLGIDESFDLVCKSGEEVPAWGANNISEENYYLEWKQSFWSLTGTTLISVTLTPAAEKQTNVRVIIHKPIQVVDPLGICYRIYRKLEKSIRNNLDQLDDSKAECDERAVVTRGSDRPAD